MLLSQVLTVGAFTSLIAGSPSELSKFFEPARPIQSTDNHSQVALMQTNQEFANRFAVPAAREQPPIRIDLRTETASRLQLQEFAPFDRASAQSAGQAESISLLRRDAAAVRALSPVRMLNPAQPQSENRPSRR